jgi:hypothetical protein
MMGPRQAVQHWQSFLPVPACRRAMSAGFCVREGVLQWAPVDLGGSIQFPRRMFP